MPHIRKYNHGGPHPAKADPTRVIIPGSQDETEETQSTLDDLANFYYNNLVYFGLPIRTKGTEDLVEDFSRAQLNKAGFVPVLGEILDIINVPWTAATGTDMYSGDDTSTLESAAWAAGGLIIPNVLQKPVQWLIKAGAKNANDIKRLIAPYVRNIDDAPADLKPLLELQNKSFELKSHLRQYDVPQGTDMGGGFKSEYHGGRATSDAAADFVTQTNPELVLNFSPSSFERGAFDEDLAKWGDAYLTSYRGVGAKNIDEAATFMRNPYGGGLQQYGRGTYSTSDLPTASGYGSYIGALRDMPGVAKPGQFGGDIVKDISNLEAFGGSTLRTYGDKPEIIRSGKGIQTTGDIVRVSRPETTVKSGILDVVPKEQADELLRYRSDFGGVGPFGRGGYGHAKTQRGTDEIIRLIAEGKLDPKDIKEKGGKINSYEKGGTLQSMAKKNRSDKNKFVSNKVKVLRKEGKGLKESVAIALDMWRKKKKKKYAEGGAVEGWGIQTNFDQDTNSLQPTDVEQPDEPQEELEALIPDPPPTYEEETFGSSDFNVRHQELGIEENVEKAGMGGYDEAIMASKLDQEINNAIEKIPIIGGIAKGFKYLGETGTNLIVGDSTGEERKRKQKISAAIFSPHKLLAMREADKTGNYHYVEETEEPEEVIPHAQSNFWSAKKPEEGFAAKGTKIKKKKYDEGGLLEALRQRRAQRRLDRTTIQPYNPEFLGKDTAGRFNQYLQEVEGVPRRSVVLDPDADDSVLTHELIHSTQYGPLQQIAAELDFKDAGRIQDKDSRKAFKKLFKSIDPKTQTFNSMGEFMIGGKEQDIEFDAIIKSAISSAKKRGYDLSGKTYGEILDTLSKARDEGNISLNMRHLGNFMNRDKETGNTWTDEQKGYIMDAIKANLDFEGYTAEDIKQDLR